MEAIEFDYQVFFYMVIGIFGLVGFMRGWWKEALTLGALVFLLAMLKYPDLANTIIGLFNSLLDFISGFLVNIGLLTNPIPHLDPADSAVYIFILIFIVIMSYFLGNSSGASIKSTMGGRLFGAILGLLNGFIILSLVREYILTRNLPNTGVSATSVPTSASVTISNTPTETILDGAGIWILIVGGLLLFFFALSSRFSYQKGKMATKPPIGYR